MLSISYIILISTPDELLAYTERKRSTPAESYTLSMCVPLPNFSVPLPSCMPLGGQAGPEVLGQISHYTTTRGSTDNHSARFSA